jgi:ribosomal protein S18 acetylase RimI-like enzyme
MQHLNQFTPPVGRLLMVVEDEKVVGTGSLRRSKPGIAEVKRMYLIPEARGRGLGRKLLDQLVDTARRDGYREVRLDTHPDIMPLAIDLYRSAGFEPCDAYPESEVPAEWHDRWVFMRRTLNDS